MAINKVILVGNVGKDPEVRHLENGTPVCNFSLATSETYTNKNGEKVTNTEWHNIVLWRTQAEIAQKFVKKGSQIYVEGKIRTRSYDDKDNIKRYVTEIVGDTFQLLGRRPDDQQNTGGSGNYTQSQATQPSATTTEFDVATQPAVGDDLPF